MKLQGETDRKGKVVSLWRLDKSGRKSCGQALHEKEMPSIPCK